MFKFLFFLNFLFFSIFALERDNYKRFEEWGIRNNINISPKMELSFRSLDDKYYIASDKIKEGEILLSIPKEIMIDTEKILKLASKKERKKYEKLREKIKDFFFVKGISIDENTTNYKIDQINLAMAEYTAIIDEKGKLLEAYEPYFSMYESNVDSYPIFYTYDQNFLLQNTSLGSIANNRKNAFYDEVNLINEVFNIYLISDEYLKSRVLTASKAFNFDNRMVLLPFTDLFLRDPNYNAEYTYDHGNLVFYIKASKSIQPGEKIKLKLPPMSNLDYLILYGKTFKDATEPKQMMVPTLSEDYLNEKKLSIEDFEGLSYMMDLMDDSFITKVKGTFQKLCQLLDEPQRDINVYNHVKEVLQKYFDSYSYIYNHEKFKEVFKGNDLENIRNVIEVEKKILKERIMMIDDWKSEIEEKNKGENDL